MYKKTPRVSNGARDSNKQLTQPKPVSAWGNGDKSFR